MYLSKHPPKYMKRTGALLMNSRQMIRSFTALAVSAATGFALTGCGDEEAGKHHAAQNFHPHDRCQVCGMVIAHYDGPKAECFIKGAGDEAVKFCSTSCAFSFILQPENKRRLQDFYLHDMGVTSWEKPEDTALIDGTKAVYVLGSKAEGAMGTEPVGFSQESAAKKFIEKEGGKLSDFGSITLDSIK